MFIDPKSNLKALAEDILRLSDFFIDRPQDQTPWTEKYCQNAYRHYFLPLNYLRNELVIRRGQEVGFFSGLQASIDWGAGPGTASLALAQQLQSQLKAQVLIEKSSLALKTFQDLHQHLKNPTTTSLLNLNKLPERIDHNRSILVFSYSLTEMLELPDGWNQFEALMILEPSTQQDGRKLLQLRNLLQQKGYVIWAPCTHQQSCPLLEKSKHDWCHDRVHVQAPKWFMDLEKHLPVKNKTITTSYLLARRTAPDFDFTNKARLTGDSLEEKGKTRQLVCRGTEREFLSWMHKSVEPQTLARGELIDMPKSFEIKSNEIRVK